MKLWKKLMTIVALAACTALPAWAADAAPQSGAMQASAAPAARALEKDAVCTKCHDESEQRPILAMYKTRHGVKADSRTPGCQSCHGASDAHVKNAKGTATRPAPDVLFGDRKDANSSFARSSPKVQGEACLSCHSSGKRLHWEGSQHQSRDIVCSNCHQVHTHSDKVLTKATQPEVCFACHKSERAQTHRISTHPLAAGKMACSDCHNPHGSTGPKLLIKNTVNETCYTCHAEKRGPFLWEHAPVADDCTNCHTPHGSSNAPLLKTRLPYLCQECHTGDHAKSIYSGANGLKGNVTTVNGTQPNQSPAAQNNARMCLNCHVLVHGSNHPAGAKFQR